MKFLNFEESKQELRRLYKENKSLKEENDKLAGQNISYWWKNEKLKREIERLKEPKAIINVNVTAEDLAKEVTRALNKSKEKEHKCTEVCFKTHVLDPIQSDIYKKFGDDIVTRSENLNEMVQFVETWRIKLIKEYPFLKDLYTMNFGELTAVYK